MTRSSRRWSATRGIILFGEDVKISMFGDTKGLAGALRRSSASATRRSPKRRIAGMAVGAAAAGHPVVLAHDVLEFPLCGLRRHRQPDDEAAVHDRRPDQAADHRALRLWRRDLDRRAAFGHALFAADESGRPQHRRPGDAGRCQGPAQDRRSAAVIRPSSSKRGRAAANRAKCPSGDHLSPFGRRGSLVPGRDVTIVAIGAMVRLALEAAESLAEERRDRCRSHRPATLVPFDTPALLASIAKTRHLVIVDEARDRCSAASHIAAIAADKGFASLRARPPRYRSRHADALCADSREGDLS